MDKFDVFLEVLKEFIFLFFQQFSYVVLVIGTYQLSDNLVFPMKPVIFSSIQMIDLKVMCSIELEKPTYTSHTSYCSNHVNHGIKSHFK